MRSSNSRDPQKTLTGKYSKQATIDDATYNKLMKTAAQPKTNKLETTSYHHPTSGKKIKSQKYMPPKVMKVDYNIDENMTESKIYEAKQGLQLLKKKLNAKGMSRQKGGSNRLTSTKTVSLSYKTDGALENHNSNIPPQKLEKKISDQGQQVSRKPSSKIPMKKTISEGPNTEARKKIQPEKNASHDLAQIPIKPKMSFQALLEKQLQKDENYIPQDRPIKAEQNNYDQDSATDQIQLVKCSEGCDRMFSTQVISKHKKICRKVFQTKRKAFNSAAYRAPEVEGFNKPLASTKNGKTSKIKPIEKEIKGGIPKWKAESLAFRASMKVANGKPLTIEEKNVVAQEQNNGKVPCKFCGRKFSDSAATRHIPFCEKKSKQMPNKRR